MLKKSIFNTWVQIVAKAITILISLVTTGLLTRKLGASVYGSYTLVISVFLLLDSISDFGTKVIGVREASKQESETRNRLFMQVAWTRLLTTLFAFILGIVLIFTWNGFALIKSEAVVALMMIWFTSVAGSLEIIFQTEMRMGLKVIMDVLFPLIFLIVLLGWGGPISLMWVFGVYLAARILSLSIGWKLLKRVLASFKLRVLDKEFIFKFLKESWPMGVYMLVFTGYDRAIDSLMIDKFVGIKEVAFYGLAYKIYSNMIQPAYYFVNSIFPLLSGKSENKRSLFKWSILIVLGTLLLLIPLAYLFAPLMINVLAGSGFEMSIKVLRILLVALFFAYLSHLFGFTLIAKGGQKQILMLGLITLVFNFIGNLFMIPRFGIIGAAWVTGFSEALACGLMVFFLKRKTSI
ncbi:MAG: oligosaccharide flippase family protein [Candidatus Shapirobacteria bacterium]|nr:oligosaccharide flippase family protein [Candidatus Shapirobacteria bacterium]